MPHLPLQVVFSELCRSRKGCFVKSWLLCFTSFICEVRSRGGWFLGGGLTVKVCECIGWLRAKRKHNSCMKWKNVRIGRPWWGSSEFGVLWLLVLVILLLFLYCNSYLLLFLSIKFSLTMWGKSVSKDPFIVAFRGAC